MFSESLKGVVRENFSGGFAPDPSCFVNRSENLPGSAPDLRFLARMNEHFHCLLTASKQRETAS